MSLSLRKPVEADWDRQKGTIRRLFLHQQCTIEELVERVKRNGIIVSKAQMEYKLKQWRFRRNVDKKAWNCIRHRITKRERSGKKSEVILSGVRLKPETILRETMRNRPLPMLGKARPSSSPEPEFDLPLRICTPPPILIESSWPESLPWIRFKTQLYEAPIVQPFFKYNLENSIDRFTNDLLHSQSTHHSPTGRDVPDCQQFASNWAWSCFNMPESYPSEHVARAEILENGSSFEKLGLTFEILIAKISNDMFDWDMIESNWPLLKAVFKHPVGSIMDRLLMQSQTIKSFSDNLYRMAILSGTVRQMGMVTEKSNVDIVHQTMIWLFKGGYHPNRLRLKCRFKFVTSLQYAVVFGDRVHETVKLLVEYGADMNLTTPLSEESSALQLVLDGAAMKKWGGRNVEVSRLCETFIKKVFKSTSMNQQESNIMLQYALRHGNKTMLEQLVSRGADLTFCQRTQHSPVSRVTAITCATEFIDTSRGESWSRWLECVVCLMTPHSQDFFRARPPRFFVDPLIAAAAAGNDDAIEHLLALGGNLDLKNEDGMYPLLAAIAKGRYHTCKLLINSGSDVNHLGPSGLSPVHIAVIAGESDILKLLVDSAADCKRYFEYQGGLMPGEYIINLLHHRLYALSEHVHGNPLEIALLLVRSSYRFSIEQGLRDCIQYLLNNGVFWSSDFPFQPDTWMLDDNFYDVLLNIDGTLSDRDQRTYDIIMEKLITLATRVKKRNVLAKFHRKRSGPNGDEVGAALAEADNDKAAALLKAGGNLYEKTSWDESFLDVALKSQDESTIRWALAADSQYYDPGALLAAVELELKYGNAPRQVNVPYYRVILNRRPESQEAHIWETTSVGKAAKWNNTELLRDLLSAIPPAKYCLLGVERDFRRYDRRQPYNYDTGVKGNHCIYGSPLACAVGLDKEAIYEIMVKRGYEPDNFTLYIAMLEGNLELAKSIISAGSGDLATKECRSGAQNGKMGPVNAILTPIQSAAIWNRTDIVRWLIDHGADVNDWNVPRLNKYEGRQSPLQAAARHGNVEMLQLLLQAGARPNDKPYGSGGLTALQEAAEMGEIGIAKLLLDHEPPADVNAHRAPSMGTTALEAAASYGRLDMVQLLLCRGAKTEGTGHRQYIRAVAMAQDQGHIEVVSLLRAHRPWTIMDQDRLVNEEADPIFTEVHESECSDSECDFLHDWSETESAGDSDKDSDKDGDTGEDNRQGDEGADERGGEERINDEDMSCAEYMIDEWSWEDWNLEHTSDMGGMTQEEFESEVALWDPVNACFK
ncbi:hypothetical protein AB5N19_03052 [Seiridium cardinale]